SVLTLSELAFYTISFSSFFPCFPLLRVTLFFLCRPSTQWWCRNLYIPFFQPSPVLLSGIYLINLHQFRVMTVQCSVFFYLFDQVAGFVIGVPAKCSYPGKTIIKANPKLGPKLYLRAKLPSWNRTNMWLIDTDNAVRATMGIGIIHVPLLLVGSPDNPQQTKIPVSHRHLFSP